ncbi:MAG: Asp23/Gls24 family envelope stress response protein [Clostridiales bacterium]|uniref:Asp23/Gls24 family envelope stress response protein n=1 Tax=Clostridium sp. N3C TaxID=1776758 RepID=UPI00092DF23A|nr:Asp23/Gls24 family envelope stress response protein [Clostridium sp. N3C]NLZ47367.1 Asp23/Gls24 family envelope stress response protein [Clostridiales bacterium]SCN21380.1 Alkaline shock protein 23 [Clostridium sp. N3C]
MDENTNTSVNMGIVKISDDVVSVIAGLAAAEVKGITGMSTGLAGGITQILGGKKNPSKGVKVTVAEDSASIDIVVGVEYGVKIPEIAKVVQDNVKKTVETMTGLKVSAVNIYVQNVIVPKNENDKDLIEE